MRKVLFLFLLLLTTGVVATAQVERNANSKGTGHSNNRKANRGHFTNGNATKTVNAPLDGGLLLVLGAAGAAYYTARKRRRES